MKCFFNHKDNHKYTWERPTLSQKSIIDFIITKQNSEMQIQNVRAYRGPNCGTDHKLINGKFVFPYFLNKVQDRKRRKKYDRNRKKI